MTLAQYLEDPEVQHLTQLAGQVMEGLDQFADLVIEQGHNTGTEKFFLCAPTRGPIRVIDGVSNTSKDWQDGESAHQTLARSALLGPLMEMAERLRQDLQSARLPLGQMGDIAHHFVISIYSINNGQKLWATAIQDYSVRNRSYDRQTVQKGLARHIALLVAARPPQPTSPLFLHTHAGTTVLAHNASAGRYLATAFISLSNEQAEEILTS